MAAAGKEAGRHGDEAETGPVPPLDWTAFALLAFSTAANGVVTWGFSLTIITLFEGRGLEHGTAVLIASFVGVAALLARPVDFVGSRRWNSLATGLLAGAGLPLSFAVLIFGTGAPAAIAFVALYGLTSGALAVARATVPLDLFPAAAYARGFVVPGDAAERILRLRAAALRRDPRRSGQRRGAVGCHGAVARRTVRAALLVLRHRRGLQAA